MATQAEQLADLQAQLATLTEALSAAKPAKASGKAATEAKMATVRRNLDPVAVELGDNLRVDVSPVSRRGDMLTAPRAYVVTSNEQGKERSASSFTAAHIEALCAGQPKLVKAFATVQGRAFPEAG